MSNNSPLVGTCWRWPKDKQTWIVKESLVLSDRVVIEQYDPPGRNRRSLTAVTLMTQCSLVSNDSDARLANLRYQASKGIEKAVKELMHLGHTDIAHVSKAYQQICQADPLLEILD